MHLHLFFVYLNETNRHRHALIKIILLIQNGEYEELREIMTQLMIQSAANNCPGQVSLARVECSEMSALSTDN